MDNSSEPRLEAVADADGAADAKATAGPGHPSFWRLLPQAFVYPVRGDGKWVILGGAGGLLLLQLIARVVPLAGLLLGALLIGYLAMYALRNVAAAANGDREPPGWPDIRGPDDVIGPLLQVLGSFALCLGPLAGYHVYLWIANVPGLPAVTYVLLIAGVLYLPMGLLGVALHDSLRGLSPLLVLPAILRVLPAYLVALAAIAAACGLVYPLWYLFQIPLAGAVLDAAFCVYWLTVVTYVIGCIYHGYRERLNWFPE
jgi:hypothetical protein